MFNLSEIHQLHEIPDRLGREAREQRSPAAVKDVRRESIGARQQIAGAQTESAEVRKGNAVLECLESDEYLTSRELRASRAADRQGLILRKLRIRCSSGSNPCRYDLVYARYNQPVASHLELAAVEAWIGFRPTPGK